jgi:hypothetical protein
VFICVPLSHARSLSRREAIECGDGFEPVALEELVAPGTMVIADLTDPMLDADSANGIFQVGKS